MLKIEKENNNLIRVELDGKLDAEEMKSGLEKLIGTTSDMKNGKMLYIIENFEIPSVGAIMVEFGKLPSLFKMISHIDRVAVIAEAKWLRNVAEWEGLLFPNLDIKAFKKCNELEARAWLSS